MSATVISLAMMCPLYHDVNTSNVIFTHTMDQAVVFTRYDHCLASPTPDGEAEGAWRTAHGRYVSNTSEVRVTFGFHETGTVKPTAITWSNGAEWRIPVREQYVGMDEGSRFTVSRLSPTQFLVKNARTNETMGIMEQICQDVFLPPRRGVIKGNVIGWNDGNVWWAADDWKEMLGAEADDDDPLFSYDEQGGLADDESYYTYEDEEDGWFEDEDDWWHSLIALRRQRKARRA